MQAEDRVYAQYFRDVSQTRMPANAQEERELFERYFLNKDLDARRRLIEGGLRFVVKTAKQYYRGDSEFLKTLIQAGNLGLLIAVDRYRPWVIKCCRCHRQNYVATSKRRRCQDCGRALCSRDAQLFTTRFLTYAAWWISEAIRTELYEASLVHIPPYKQKEHHRARRSGGEAGFVYVSYDTRETCLTEGDQETAGEYSRRQLCREMATETEADISNDYTHQRLHEQLRAMKDRHAYVLIAYYGLREEAKTLREIADRLGVSAERVRQIKVDAMDDLRTRLEQQQIRQAADAYLN
jgi:RNA polymerase sigma factor (sigma-70 family)